MKITWGWDLVLLLSILALLVCVFSFDMIDNWEKKRRSDTNILLLSVSIYALLVLAVSEVDNPIKNILGSALLVLAMMGHVAATDEFNNDNASNSQKPWELWFVAFFTLIVLLGCVVWIYYYTEVGKGAQRSVSKLSSELEVYKMKRRARAKARARARTNAIEMDEF